MVRKIVSNPFERISNQKRVAAFGDQSVTSKPTPLDMILRPSLKTLAGIVSELFKSMRTKSPRLAFVLRTQWSLYYKNVRV